MECECGCGKNPAQGVFLPGHDQRLRAALERRVGGLLALRELVGLAERYVDGRLAGPQFSDQVERLLQNQDLSK